MYSWSIRTVVAALLIAGFVGCDSNPGGPSAPSTPTTPAPGASVNAPPQTPGVMPTKSKTQAPTANTPTKPD